jgi:hypothetical protein
MDSTKGRGEAPRQGQTGLKTREEDKEKTKNQQPQGGQNH